MAPDVREQGLLRGRRSKRGHAYEDESPPESRPETTFTRPLSRENPREALRRSLALAAGAVPVDAAPA